MRLALRELRRRPGRFAAPVAVLTLIGLLLMFLGGLLDGLVASSVGAIQAQPGDVIVYADSAESSFPRSRITPEQREQVTRTPGVREVGGLGVVQLGARRGDPASRDLLDVALFGYELAPTGVPAPPPAPSQAYADESLREQGVVEGTVLLLGPARTPVTVIGFTPTAKFGGQPTLWASADTWRSVQAANRPDARSAPGVFQALVVKGEGDPSALASRIDSSTGGTTETLTTQAAAAAVPGVSEQKAVFNQILGVTVVVATIVVALFFALLTVERLSLYGVLKALGTRSRSLFGGLVTQAVAVSAVAALIGGTIAAIGAASVPPGGIPLDLGITRIVLSVVLLLLAAVIGCTFSLRRVLRVDPASAIGSSS